MSCIARAVVAKAHNSYNSKRQQQWQQQQQQTDFQSAFNTMPTANDSAWVLQVTALHMRSRHNRTSDGDHIPPHFCVFVYECALYLDSAQLLWGGGGAANNNVMHFANLARALSAQNECIRSNVNWARKGVLQQHKVQQ